MHFSSLVAIALAAAPLAFARPTPQIGGDAQGLYDIVNDVDNGVGYAIENVEDNLADLIEGKHTGSDSEGSGAGGSTGGGAAPGPAPAPAGPAPAGPAPQRRQLNKISAGLQNLGDALHISGLTDPIADLGDELDTLGTNGQAELGAAIASVEDPGLPELANDLTNLNPRGA